MLTPRSASSNRSLSTVSTNKSTTDNLSGCMSSNRSRSIFSSQRPLTMVDVVVLVAVAVLLRAVPS